MAVRYEVVAEDEVVVEVQPPHGPSLFLTNTIAEVIVGAAKRHRARRYQKD